jgi:hypothetical protein
MELLNGYKNLILVKGPQLRFGAEAIFLVWNLLISK